MRCQKFKHRAEKMHVFLFLFFLMIPISMRAQEGSSPPVVSERPTSIVKREQGASTLPSVEGDELPHFFDPSRDPNLNSDDEDESEISSFLPFFINY